ncbi:MAG: glycosyltransferase family 4 protein, partial [Candidatus Odinarchaeota archaeon]
MRLLMIANISLPAITGDAVHFLELARHFHKQNVKVTIIAPEPLKKGFKNILGVRFHFYKRFFTPLLGNFLNMLNMVLTVFKVCKASKFDAIYLRQSTFFFIVNILARLFSLPVFFEINGLYYYEAQLRNERFLKVGLYKLLDTVTINKAKGVICVSTPLYNYVRNIR